MVGEKYVVVFEYASDYGHEHINRIDYDEYQSGDVARGYDIADEYRVYYIAHTYRTYIACEYYGTSSEIEEHENQCGHGYKRQESAWYEVDSVEIDPTEDTDHYQCIQSGDAVDSVHKIVTIHESYGPYHKNDCSPDVYGKQIELET